ncbi:enoyl-CoA hydratase-related protein [Umezawaea sp. Da 62-37]|uniref:enoyl-CoA hydratase-related protein n=1 Tax=Umezawaea sp. Da 62-37 TaxID=3075927 RepID=UPI0028F6CE06|nr:enoyl-CoA hydratase-related protein [Umezawaea sp. Da 62-37]WNV84104.1 enoyl-CoA hydratase-related protein [Umezawaea sp. Da 62-37]
MTHGSAFGHDDGLMPVILEFLDGVALVLVGCPPTGMDDSEATALRSALDAASDADAVVLHGGGGAFLPGIEPARLARTTPAELTARAEAFRRLCEAVAVLPVPVVAAIAGHVSGGGCAVAMACDARVLVVGGSLGRLTTSDADRPVLTGRRVDAEEALRTGLVDLVVRPCALLASAHDLALDHATDKPRKRVQEYAKVR